MDDLFSNMDELDRLRRENAALRAENARLLTDPGENTPGKFRKGGLVESKLAAFRVQPKTGTIRWKVLNAIREVYPEGRADEQIKDEIRHDIRSVSTRRDELRQGGWVVKAPETWLAPSGNDVSVWILSSTAADQFGLARRQFP